MSNGGDRRAFHNPHFAAAARGYIEPENLFPPRRRRVYLTEENHSLLNSFRSSFALTPQETATRTESLFNLMTSNDAAQFREVISRLGEEVNLRRMASLLTSNNDSFLQTARNKNGSKSIQELLGKSDDVDTFFFNAIMRCFYYMMSNWEASGVAILGMRVFSDERRTIMYDQVLHHAVDLACDPNGYMVLNRIITGWDRSLYRDRLSYVVALNAYRLSRDNYGQGVVQHVLRLNDLRCTRTIAVSLTGHFVNLSFMKYGSHIVEKLLDTEGEAVMVVGELLRGEALPSLARDGYGNYVVLKALRVMREMGRRDLFRGLVDKLMPFVHILRLSPGRIAAFLDSLHN